MTCRNRLSAVLSYKPRSTYYNNVLQLSKQGTGTGAALFHQCFAVYISNFNCMKAKTFFHWLSIGLKLLRWNHDELSIALLIVFFAQSPQRIYQSWHHHRTVVWEIYSRSYQALIQIYLRALVVYTPRAAVLILEVYHRLLRLVSIVSTVICHSSLPPHLLTNG